MSNSRTEGRMIKKDISNSNKFASLTPHAAVLFAMLIPHFNSHGKMNGGPGFIKDEICPKIPYLTYKNIPELLQEITDKTNVKWFEHDGRFWIHSINFLSDHQKLDDKKLGQDLLPTYSRVALELVGHEVEVEVEVEVKEEVEGEGKSGATPPKPPAPVKVKYLDFVFLLPAEHDKLIARYGPDGAAGWIERVNRYAHKIGEKKFKKKYSSHYHVILEWSEKDGGNGNGQNANSSGGRCGGAGAKQLAREMLGIRGGSSRPSPKLCGSSEPSKDAGRVGGMAQGLDSTVIEGSALEAHETG